MTEKTFFERLRSNPNPVVVDFWAPWCGPCRMVDPLLKKLGQEFEGRVDIWKINADEQPELLRALKIYGIPTVIGFKEGREIVRQAGVTNYSTLASIFDSAATGEVVVPADAPLTWIDRLLRTAIGGTLLFLAYWRGFQGVYLIFAGLGLLALFSAIHDRCPVWQAIKPKLKELFKINPSA